jgi:DNA-binding CsgD family transcriptional regulator
MVSSSPLKKDNILFSCADDVNRLCEPLFKYFDIGNFTYLQVFPDMSRVHLDSDPYWTETFYTRIEDYSKGYLTESHHWGTGYSPMLMLEDTCIPDCIAHDAGEGVVLTKQLPGATEFAYITHSWKKYQESQLQLLLRNIDLLQLFLDYFRKEAKDLIDQSAKDPILCPFMQPREEVQAFQTLDIERESFIRDINKRYNKNDLTPRELDCIYYTSLDMTAKETARQLNISPKTVERHLENAKNKFGCRTKAALVRQALIS